MRAGTLVRALALFVACGCFSTAVWASRGGVVYEGIESHAAQVSVMWGNHANAIGRVVDGAVIAEANAVREREEARAARARSLSSGVCEGVEGFRAAAASRAHEMAMAGRGNNALGGWFDRDTVRASESSASVDMRTRSDEVLERYCAPGRVVEGGAACKGEYEDHASDLHSGAVLGAGTFQDEKSAIAGIEWVRNIANPAPEPAMPLRAARSVTGRRALLAHRGRDARTGLATWYLQGLVGARLPAVSADAWAASAGAGSREEGARSMVGRHEFLGLLARERYERPDFLAGHQAADQANLLREWIVSEGASLVLAFDEYRDAERQGAMLAARLARAARDDRRR